MIIVVLLIAVFIYCIIMMALYSLGENVDRIKYRIGNIENLNNDYRKSQNQLNKSFKERFLKPTVDNLLNSMSNLMPQARNSKLSKMIVSAGYVLTPEQYALVRLIITILCGIITTLLAVFLNLSIFMTVIFTLLGMLMGMLILKYRLYHKIRIRKTNMKGQMPEMLDLLCVSVEAGLGFDAALVNVIDHMEGQLINELKVMHNKIMLGQSRKRALIELGQRTDIEEMATFTSAIIQSEQLGIPLKNVLSAQADQMRTSRRQMIEEKVMKAPVKIILPLVFFVFPVLLIILLAPAVINIVGVLRG